MPDPYAASGGPGSPASWNRYSFTRGDPVNRSDPQGLEDIGDGLDDDGGTAIPADSLAEACDNPSLILALTMSGADTSAISQACPQYFSAPAPAPPPQPTCSIELYSRPAFVNHNPGKHTYVDVIDPELEALGYSSDELMLEAGPSNHLPYGGLLTGTYNPPGLGLGQGTSHASNPSASNNKEIGTPDTGAAACGVIQEMLASITTYNNSNAQVPYAALPSKAFGTYNSNSFTFTLLSDYGLASYFGNLSTSGPLGLPYPGWGLSVPGLNAITF